MRSGGWWALVGALIVLAGCVHSKPTGEPASEDSGGSESSAVEAGVFAPERVRVHGLTRLVSATGTEPSRIDLHMELLDRYGHGVKALGEVRVELYEGSISGDRTREGAMQRRLWRLDLRDPAVNAEAFDRVTRTYWLILRDLPEEVLRDPAGVRELQVRFTMPGGREISTIHPLL